MRNIAPDIFRQRFLIEGFYAKEKVTADDCSDFLKGIAAHLNLKTYGEPIVFAPASGMGKEENSGFDAFIPLIDSGISLYVWTGPKFVSTVLYTCKGFEEERALAYAREFFGISGETFTHGF